MIKSVINVDLVLAVFANMAYGNLARGPLSTDGICLKCEEKKHCAHFLVLLAIDSQPRVKA